MSFWDSGDKTRQDQLENMSAVERLLSPNAISSAAHSFFDSSMIQDLIDQMGMSAQAEGRGVASEYRRLLGGNTASALSPGISRALALGSQFKASTMRDEMYKDMMDRALKSQGMQASMWGSLPPVQYTSGFDNLLKALQVGGSTAVAFGGDPWSQGGSTKAKILDYLAKNLRLG